VPLGAFLLLPLLRGPRLGGGDREARDGTAARREAELRILPRLPISITLLSDIAAPPCGAGP
jgi:hypothetical protein